MAYRRKTYKKRFTKRKKSYFKKRTFKRRYANSTKRYTGQLNIACETTYPLTQEDGESGSEGCKVVVLWGANTSIMIAEPYNWADTAVFGINLAPEWNLYRDRFQEYRITGVKMRFVPGTFIGDSGDGRTTRQLHVASSAEAFSEANISRDRLAAGTDYGAYTMNTNRNQVKRYYKPAAYNKRKGQIEWQLTGSDSYSNALTYFFWEISGVNSSSLVVGDMTVTYYIQFRKPKMSQIPIV